MVIVQKAGDTRPAVLKTNMNLINSTIELKVKDPAGAAVVTTGSVTITDAWVGLIEWDHNGTLIAGTYTVELWITRDGELYKAPSEGYESIRITADLVTT